jgi:uncharacterized damage-inducible protein DinB
MQYSKKVQTIHPQMPSDLGEQFQRRIDAAAARLQTITEAESNETLRDGGWSRKQVLGHLIDSALNNHQRFVRASLEGHYEGPSYEQQGWVGIHGYGDLAWADLVEQWRKQNELLARVVANIPESSLNASCQVGKDPTVTLSFLILDYLIHMEAHVEQIAGGARASVGSIFIADSIHRMEQMRRFIQACLGRLSDEHVWRKDNENCNAIGNLILHLCGNIEQWMEHGIAGAADHRNRDAEFAARGGHTPAELAEHFHSTIDRSVAILKALPASRLVEIIHPQDEDVTILEGIYRVVGHMQQHTGQIVMMAKQLTGQDLKFYAPASATTTR